MKVGIITFSSAHNYGAVLQAYALQEYLTNQGLTVEIINYRIPQIDNVYKVYRYKRSKYKPVNALKKVKRMIRVRTKERWRIIKYNNFEAFIKEVLNTTRVYPKLKSLQNDHRLDHDILIAGSDQIWNPQLTKAFMPAYFLEFGKSGARKIAYAASFGLDEVPPKYKVFFERYLQNFDFISVREENMVDLFQPYVNRTLTNVLDPTLLLDKKDYDKLKKPTAFAGQDYIYVHYIGVDEKLDEIADQVSRLLGLKIVHNRLSGWFENELSGNYAERPEQFVSLIENAKYVISNSFHTTVLALIYGKDFITVPHQKRPIRMTNLLRMVDLMDHLVEDVRLLPDLESLTIDYQGVKRRINAAKVSSVEFLDNAIHGTLPEKNEDNYFYTGNKFNCYGCRLCEEICPTDAIQMREDSEGFVYPEIDKGKCIHCGLCERRCIYRNNQWNPLDQSYPIVYAAVHKSPEVLQQSTSGGLFTAFYEYVLENGGYVVGVRYNVNMEVEYCLTNQHEVCEQFRGSKYVAASIRDVRKQIKEKLDDGKMVLFSGNPCQNAALKKYLGKDYPSLILLEIICYGIASPKVFRKYLIYLEEKYKSKIVDFKFRDKSQGYGSKKSLIKVVFENGRVITEPAYCNDLNRGYANSSTQRPCCYNCEYTDYKRVSDITIGDFWGVEKFIPEAAKKHTNGISVLIVNNQRGKQAFDKVKDQFELYESNLRQAYAANHKFPMVYGEKRVSLMENLDGMPISDVLRKYNQFKEKDKNKEIIHNSL